MWDAAYNTAVNFTRRGMDMFRNTRVGAYTMSVMMHSSNMLPDDLRVRVHTASAIEDAFLVRTSDPVVFAAEKMGYDPKLDDTWWDAIAQNHDLDAIMRGQVDFQKYMGDRYSPEAVEFIRWWAWARHTAPREIGFTPAARYDERRRKYYSSDRALSSKTGNSPDNEPGQFITRQKNHRTLKKEDVTFNSRPDNTHPNLTLFIHDMEMLGRQKAFQPLKRVNGEIQFAGEDLAYDLWSKAYDPNATEAERMGAKNTYDLITGNVNMSDRMSWLMGNHADAVLTNNLGSAYANLVSIVTLPNAPRGTILDAIKRINDPDVQELVKQARLQNQIKLLQSFSDPKKIHFSDEGIDLYRESERYSRTITYVAHAMYEAEKAGVPFADVVKGTSDGMKIRGKALEEVQNTQGIAHRNSIRMGRVIVPGSFHLKNQRISEYGRTLAQLRQGMSGGGWTPFAWNIGTRLALGGGKMIMDPETAQGVSLLISMMPADTIEAKDNKNKALMALGRVKTGKEVVDLSFLGFTDFKASPLLQQFDEMSNMNLTSKSTLGSLSLPGSEVLEGRAAPFDFSSVGPGLGTLGDQNALPSRRVEAFLRVAGTSGSLIPSKNVGGVRVSIPMLSKAAQSAQHLLNASKGRGEIVGNTSIPTNPIQAAAAPFFGGHNAGGNLARSRVAYMEFDKGYVKKQIRGALATGIPESLPDLLSLYVDTYGDLDPTIRALPREARAAEIVKQALQRSETSATRDLRIYAGEAVQSLQQGDSEKARQQVQEIDKDVEALKDKNPTEYLKLDTRKLLKSRIKT